MRFYNRPTQAVLRRPVELGLTSTIGMMQQARRRASTRQRHGEGVERQVIGDALAHRPTHGEARVEIEEYRQVEPPLAGRNVGVPVTHA